MVKSGLKLSFWCHVWYVNTAECVNYTEQLLFYSWFHVPDVISRDFSKSRSARFLQIQNGGRQH